MSELTHISSADLVGHKVEELADTPNISTTALKQIFDSLSTDVIVPKFNALADELDELAIDKRVASEEITNIKLDSDDNIVISKDNGATYEKTNSSGHKIMTGGGIVMPAENRLQFSDNVVIIDKPDENKTFLSIPSGIKGDKGDGATVRVGTTEEGDEASVVNVGSEQDAIFNFTIPRGEQGNAATISVGTTTTGNAGTQASVTNSGTRQEAIFNFAIPKGDKGDPGTGLTLKDTYATLSDLQAAHPTGSVGDAYIVGDADDNTVYLWSTTTHAWEDVGQLKGEKGDQGNAGTIQIGFVETVAQDEVYVENVGTATNAILNMGVPKGDRGLPGTPATVSVGTVTKGDEASVTNVGTTSNAVFNFVLPKGDQGDQGSPTVVNNKTGQSIVLYGTDITISADDNTPLSEMTGGAKAYTTSEWEALDHSTISDGTQIVITDDYDSNICSTIAECEASESVDDVAGASALKELANRGEVYSTSEQVIGKWIDGKTIYRRVINFATVPTNTSEAEIYDASAFNIDSVIRLEMIIKNGISHFIGGSYVNQGNTYRKAIYYKHTNKKIILGQTNADLVDFHIVIEYTKTTD